MKNWNELDYETQLGWINLTHYSRRYLKRFKYAQINWNGTLIWAMYK